MGLNSSQPLPQIIEKTWQQMPYHPHIYVNSLTCEQVQEHILTSPTPFQLDSFKSRIKQPSISVCRVAFYFHTDSERFHIYTEEKGSFINVENDDSWLNKKLDVVATFRYLAKNYGYMKVCQGMIGMDKTGQVKCWIHPNVLSAQVWSSCESEQEMIEDIDNLFEAFQSGNKNRRRNRTICEGLMYPKTYENSKQFCFSNRLQSKNPSIKKVATQTHKIGNLPYFLRQNEESIKNSKGSISICSSEKKIANQNTTIKTSASIQQNQQEDEFVLRRTRTCLVDDLEANNLEKNKRKTSLADQTKSWMRFRKIQKKSSLDYENFYKSSKINTLQKNSEITRNSKESNLFDLSRTMKPSEKLNLTGIQTPKKRNSFSTANTSELDKRKREKISHARSIEKRIEAKENVQTEFLSVFKVSQKDPKSMKLSKKLVNVACIPVRQERQSQLACIENQQGQHEENGPDFQSLLSFFDEEEKTEYFEIQNKVKAKNKELAGFRKQVNKLLLEASL